MHFVSSSSTCCLVTSRGQHELKVYRPLRQRKALCRPGYCHCGEAFCIAALCVAALCVYLVSLTAVLTIIGLVWIYWLLWESFRFFTKVIISVSSGLVALGCHTHSREIPFNFSALSREKCTPAAVLHPHLYLLPKCLLIQRSLVPQTHICCLSSTISPLFTHFPHADTRGSGLH